MSQEPFNHSPDLQRLREEGFYVQILGGFLLLKDIPYVDSNSNVKRGTLISQLALSGDVAQPPNPHTIYFVGAYPCGADGVPIRQLKHSSKHFDLGGGLTAQHQFSCKPADTGRYIDYFEKMTTYMSIISAPAEQLQPGITARTFKVPDWDEENTFNYIETASGRAGIGALTDLLRHEKVAIIGLGGTGSYILDLIAKTPVSELRLFDGDEFLTHNAFRAPGAPTIEELREAPKKVDYFKAIYSKMHRNILAYPEQLDEANLHRLDGVTFAFISIDAVDAKLVIIQKLEELGISFIDVGMGLDLCDGSLGGILRVTTSTASKRKHVHAGKIPLDSAPGGDVYESNIQVVDLNALNATLAVIKWKKLLKFYRDEEQEHHCLYTTDGNILNNNELNNETS
ncbi:MAG: ThiF family adenylyltransferase [Akkermansiaceae bacterium]